MGHSPPQAPTTPNADVLAAIETLSIKDVERLKNYALWKMSAQAGRERSHEWKDLLQQAYFKTLYGERPWSPEDLDKSGRLISIVQHLFGCMRSIAHGWREKESRNISLSAEHVAADNTETQVEAETCLEQLFQALKGDFDALLVLETIQRGYLPSEAQEEFRLPNGRYWAARKRITRRGKELFASSKDLQP